MFVISYSVTCCIYIPGKPGFCFHYYCAFYDECRSCTFVCILHHPIIIIVQTYLKTLNIKCLSDIFCRVLGLCHETMVSAVCLYILTETSPSWVTCLIYMYMNERVGRKLSRHIVLQYQMTVLHSWHPRGYEFEIFIVWRTDTEYM